MRTRRILAVLTGMLMLAVLPVMASAEEANMVENGGFEQALESWETTGTVTAAAEAAYSEESGAVLSGAGSVYQTVEIPAGTTVLVSAWVKAAEGADAAADGVRLTARFNELDGNPVVGVTSYTANSSWTKLTACGTAAETATLYVRLQTRGTAQIFVDDVEVIEKEAAIAEGEFFTMDAWSKKGVLSLVEEEERGTVANFTTDYNPGSMYQTVYGLRPNTAYYVMLDAKSTVDAAAGVSVSDSANAVVVAATKDFASTDDKWRSQCVRFMTRNFEGTGSATLSLLCAKDQTVRFDNVRIVPVDEHVYNGGFEYDMGTTGFLTEGGDGFTAEIKTDDKVSGNRSVLLTMTGEGMGALYTDTEQSSHLVANKAYEVSVYVKPVQENTVVQLFLEAKKNDGGWKDNPDFYATKTYENLPLNEWSKVSFAYVNDAYQTRLFPKLRIVGAGAACFDDFSIKEITESGFSFASGAGYVLDEIETGGVTVNGRYLSKAVDTESVMLIAAVYGEKNNAAYVADVAVSPVQSVAAGAYADFTATVTVPNDENAYTVKAFLWNSEEGLQPIEKGMLQ